MEDKVKLLCLGVDLEGGGAERAQVVFLRHLDRELFAPKVVYLRRSGPLLTELPQDISIRFLFDTNVLPSSSLRKPKNLLYVFNHLSRHIREADVVFVMIEGGLTYLGVTLAQLMGKPVITWLEVNWSDMLKDRANWHRWISRRIYPLAHGIIAVSKGAADDLCAFAPGACSRIRVIPNPIDLALIYRKAKGPTPEWVEGWFDKPVAVAVGRLHRQKGFDLLISAFAQAVEAGMDWKLLILGEGAERVRLERQVAALGLQARVRLPGFVSNPYPFMRRSNLFVLSSRYEGLPTVLIEALALGLPVVSTDCPSGPREILGDQYPFLVPVENPQELARVLIQAMKAVEAGAMNSREYVALAKAYDAPKVTREISELIIHILHTKRSPGRIRL